MLLVQKVLADGVDQHHVVVFELVAGLGQFLRGLGNGHRHVEDFGIMLQLVYRADPVGIQGDQGDVQAPFDLQVGCQLGEGSRLTHPGGSQEGEAL